MAGVDIVYSALQEIGPSRSEVQELGQAANDLRGDDVGVENPAQRPDLRLEMHARVTSLHKAARERVSQADDLTSAVTEVVSNFSELDITLGKRDADDSPLSE